MDDFNSAELSGLIVRRDEPAVSVYQPTHRAGAGIQQDPIRYKNLLRSAQERLIESGLRSAEADQLLEPARRLLDDEVFWQHQSDGLALFASNSIFRYYRVPFQFEELVVVTDRFHIKPLIRLLSEDGRFYILALSGKQVRLMLGTRHSVSEMDLEEVPQGLAEALRFDDPERQLQFHTASRGSSAIFHGQGDVFDAKRHKKDLLRYFQQVDRGLHELLRQREEPLVLAAVDYLIPIYREANTYPNLLEEGITGNPDLLNARELHERAWSLVEPHFERAREKKLARYRELQGTGLTAREIDEIVPAAYHGRIDTLFVATGVQRWGRYDEGQGGVVTHEEPEPGDEDLLDLAAVQTLVHSGEVYAVGTEQIPDVNGGSPAVALLRF
jgi:hypothetical protein